MDEETAVKATTRQQFLSLVRDSVREDVVTDFVAQTLDRCHRQARDGARRYETNTVTAASGGGSPARLRPSEIVRAVGILRSRPHDLDAVWREVDNTVVVTW